MRFLPNIFTGITGRLLGILALVTLGFLILGSFAYTETRHIEKQWQDFQSQATVRIQLLEEIRQHFGYGGVIHHFKNYVLRGQAVYRKHFEESFTQLQATLNRYQKLSSLTSEESQKIKAILQIADKYHKNINLIDNMLQQEKTIAQIDATVKIDNAPALSAMATINSLFQSLAQQKTETFKTSLSLYQLHLFSIIIITIILVTILIVWLNRRITLPLKQAGAMADSIATGNLNNQIEIKTHDEVGQFLQAFASMQTQLRERFKKEKRITDKALRLTRALDQITTSILITDADYNIIYRNKAIQRLFKEAQNKIRKDLPHFDAERLLGTNLEMFHKEPAFQRQLLEQLTTSRYATITVGGLSFDHVITPVVNPNGGRFGVVVEFHNRTKEKTLTSELNVAIEAILSGNFQQNIALDNKNGFFKLISESINQIIELNQEVIENTICIFAALAKGDLTQIIDKKYAGAFEQLKNDANFTVDKLTTVTTAIKRTTDKVNNIAEEISHNNINLSQRLEEQATSLEETATSMEQMTATVQQTADNAKQATQLATEAREQAKKGGEVVGSAILAITEISRSSKKITDIIGVIDEIAFQTNLLALNASVEAARAGEYGRGFAVVASEVRNLAQRSAEAAKEIKTLIQDSVVKVEEGTKLANHSGKTLEKIVLAVTKVSDIIADIAATSQEQSSGIQQVNKAIAQMDVMTQQNASLVEEANSASDIMKEQAQNLKEQVNFFKVNEPKLSPDPQKTTVQNLSTPKTTTEQQLNSVIPSHDYDGEWEDF